jgi:hypothetical protein
LEQRALCARVKFACDGAFVESALLAANAGGLDGFFDISYEMPA